jgi:Domain of unknown function (DUF4376)
MMKNKYIPTYLEVISIKYSTLNVSIIGYDNDYKNIVSNDDQVIPSQSELDSIINEITVDNLKIAIKEERDYRSHNGGYKVGDYWFHSDQASKLQQMALVMLGQNMPSDLMWKTMSGEYIRMTPMLAQQIFGTAIMTDQMIFGAAEYHISTMKNSETPWSYEFTSGWPKTYSEDNNV